MIHSASASFRENFGFGGILFAEKRSSLKSFGSDGSTSSSPWRNFGFTGSPLSPGFAFLIGPVKRVMALSATGRKTRTITNGARNGEVLKVTTPTTYHALLEFAQGACVTVSLSWDVWAHKHQNMELYGQTGAMFVPDPNFFGGDVMVAGSDQEPKALPQWDHPFGKNNWGKQNSQTDLVWANYRCAGLADMADAIMKKRLARCDISMVAHVVEVMTAVMESGEKYKVIKLKSSCKRPAPLGPEEAQALLK